MGKHIDISGQKFGKLTVGKYIGGGKWECICECGKKHIVLTASLKSGNTKSCGCAKIKAGLIAGKNRVIDISGQKFGRLTVVKYDGKSKWECLCDCGNVTMVRTCYLKDGTTKSCGCLSKEVSKENGKRMAAFNPSCIVHSEYERIHGILPDGYHVMLLDGDVKNTSCENMIVVSKKTHSLLYSNGLARLGELTKTAALAFELLDKTKELEKNKT